MKGIKIIDFFGPSSRSSRERRILIEKRRELRKQGIVHDKTKLDWDYFDNPDNPTGYGGYIYDGRFQKSAREIYKYYNLNNNSRVFELGPAKGFLLAEFAKLGCKIYGQDASIYAIENSHELAKGRILYEKAPSLPWKDNFFDLIIAKDVLTHLEYNTLTETIKELIRISKNQFFDIECGRTDYEIEALKDWDETHIVCKTPEFWHDLLQDIRFNGEVNFKVLICEEGMSEHVRI